VTVKGRVGPWTRLSRRDADAVANVAFLLVAALLTWFIVSAIQRHRRGLVAERGMSIGADLGALADQPRVRVRALAVTGPDRVLLVLRPEVAPDDGMPSADLELVVNLRAEEFGFNQLQAWKQSQSVLAIVMPPDSHILRLRAIDDLQPVTLRRVERGSP
jgi:hypothetical protein